MLNPIQKQDCQGTLVWIELTADGGHVSELSLEALTAARQLGQNPLSKAVSALVLSSTELSEAAKQTLMGYGVYHIYQGIAPQLAQKDNATLTEALSQAIVQIKPAFFITATCTTCLSVLPRVAFRHQYGYTPDCTAIEDNGIDVLLTRPLYSGKILCQVASPKHPQMLVLRPKAFTKQPADSIIVPGYTNLSLDLNSVPYKSELLSVESKGDSGKVRLEEADAIVSGGRGLKGPENFHLIEALAAKLNAGVGATRAVVDAGWRPHEEQIGQTGKTVSPELYFALGIHGAIQHQVGMNTSRNIIAVNTNPEAPIFELADLGIVGDVFDVLPALISKL